MQSVAKRLQLGRIEVQIDDGDVRLDVGSGWLWGVMPHPVRNGVDHGLRAARVPRLRLSARVEREQLIIEIEDNGGGIDWPALKRRAIECKLPSDSRADLVAALFSDNVSTRSQVTQLAGRGVGLSAVRAAVEGRGRRIDIARSDGDGTSFRISVPLAGLIEPTGPNQALSA